MFGFKGKGKLQPIIVNRTRYDMHRSDSVKPGLHIVVKIAEHACEHALKKISNLSTYQLQIFPAKYEYLRSLHLCKDQGIHETLKKRTRKHMLVVLTTYMEARFKTNLCNLTFSAFRKA